MGSSPAAAALFIWSVSSILTPSHGGWLAAGPAGRRS
jgi:hypothetical protein